MSGGQASCLRSAHEGGCRPVYAAVALSLRAGGWRGVLPLDPGTKGPPPSGFTGYQGQDPSDDEIASWLRARPCANVALRYPDDVLGLDVDDYGGKARRSDARGARAAMGQLAGDLDDHQSGGVERHSAVCGGAGAAVGQRPSGRWRRRDSARAPVLGCPPVAASRRPGLSVGGPGRFDHRRVAGAGRLAAAAGHLAAELHSAAPSESEAVAAGKAGRWGGRAVARGLDPRADCTAGHQLGAGEGDPGSPARHGAGPR